MYERRIRFLHRWCKVTVLAVVQKPLYVITSARCKSSIKWNEENRLSYIRYYWFPVLEIPFLKENIKLRREVDFGSIFSGPFKRLSKWIWSHTRLPGNSFQISLVGDDLIKLWRHFVMSIHTNILTWGYLTFFLDILSVKNWRQKLEQQVR